MVLYFSLKATEPRGQNYGFNYNGLQKLTWQWKMRKVMIDSLLESKKALTVIAIQKRSCQLCIFRKEKMSIDIQRFLRNSCLGSWLINPEWSKWDNFFNLFCKGRSRNLWEKTNFLVVGKLCDRSFFVDRLRLSRGRRSYTDLWSIYLWSRRNSPVTLLWVA